MQRHAAPTDAAKQVHRLTQWIPQRQPQLVVAQRPRQRRPQRVLRTKETVRRHTPVDALVRAEEVVVSDPVAQTPLSLRQIVGAHPLPQLLADRLPQTLALAHRLRVTRSRQHMADAQVLQALAESALAAPAVILRTPVREDLRRLAVAQQTLLQRLEHQLVALMRQQTPGHDVAAVIVQEQRQIHTPPRTRQHVARDVALPQLTRPRPLETTRQRATLASPRRVGIVQPVVLQHTTHRARRDRQAQETTQQITDAPQPRARLLALGSHDRSLRARRDAATRTTTRLQPLCLGGSRTRRRAAAQSLARLRPSRGPRGALRPGPVHQRTPTALRQTTTPLAQRRDAHTPALGKHLLRHTRALKRSHRSKALLRRVATTLGTPRVAGISASRQARIAVRRVLTAPLAQTRRREALACAEDAHLLVRRLVGADQGELVSRAVTTRHTTGRWCDAGRGRLAPPGLTAPDRSGS